MRFVICGTNKPHYILSSQSAPRNRHQYSVALGRYNGCIYRIPHRNNSRHTEEHGKEKSPGKFCEHRTIPHCALPQLFWRTTPVERQLHHLLWRRLHTVAMDYSIIGIHWNYLRHVQRRTSPGDAPTRDLRQQRHISSIHPSPPATNPIHTLIQSRNAQMAKSIIKKEGLRIAILLFYYRASRQ